MARVTRSLVLLALLVPAFAAACLPVAASAADVAPDNVASQRDAGTAGDPGTATFVRLPDEPAPPSSETTGHPAHARLVESGFTPPVAMVRQVRKDTEIPAMRLSLALINFVGDVDPLPDDSGGTAYAILPLAHESLLEVYDVRMQGGRVETEEQPHVRRMMGSHEAYILRLPEFGEVPAQVVCVTSHGQKRCWNPGFDDLGGGFIKWSSAKGIR